MKKLFALLLAGVMLFSCVACGSSGSRSSSRSRRKTTESDEQTITTTKGLSAQEITQLKEFYDLVKESSKLLDKVANSIYEHLSSGYYGNDEFNIAFALFSCEDDVNRIKELDKSILKAYVLVNKGKQATLVKKIYTIYCEYYRFVVVNADGPLDSFSAGRDDLKGELTSLLRDLSYEL